MNEQERFVYFCARCGYPSNAGDLIDYDGNGCCKECGGKTFTIKMWTTQEELESIEQDDVL